MFDCPPPLRAQLKAANSTARRPARPVDRKNFDAMALCPDVAGAQGKILNAIIQVAEGEDQISRTSKEPLDCSRLTDVLDRSQYVKNLELQVQRLGGDIYESKGARSGKAPAPSLPRINNDSASSVPIGGENTGTVQEATFSKIPLPFFHQTEQSVAHSKASIRHGKLNMQIFADVFSFHVNVGLIKSSFDEICEVYPFFTVPDLEVLKVLEQEEITVASRNLAITNSLLALTVQFKVANEHMSELLPIAWARFKSSYARLLQLITQPPCISACQELLYMVMFLQGFADVRTAHQLSSIAVTVIRTIASSRNNMSDLSVEDSLVLWGLFSLHVEISLRCGVAPSAYENGFPVPHPTRDALDNCTNHFAPKGYANFVVARAELALIQSKLAHLDTDTTLNHTSLEESLESWATKTFGDTNAEESEESLSLPILSLRFIYHHSRFRLARFSQHSPEVGVLFAQSTLRLLRHVPNQQYLTLWRILIYPLWATLALFEDTLRTPDSPRACTNHQLIQTMYSFLESTQKSQHCDLKYMVEGLSKICALTAAALPKQQVGEDTVSPASSSGDQRTLKVGELTLRSTLQSISNANQHSKHSKILVFLRQYRDFMPLAQGLIGNMPEPSKVQEFSNLLGIYFQSARDFGPFVPKILRPELYNFAFEYVVEAIVGS
ncbi:unnamed protein product [Clonostachys rosea]|uniref:Transcription factor domain-containing protein n=1 Tax=Bionectria ochroleuca TaxID=29856 RepID=A0ABY6UMT2_BIOOC|nr:unnamed protein product [Clonostachys rosea]